METFESKQGAVIIMNPDNGDILAMVNYPDFDPNQTQNLDLEKAKNSIVTESYELGSVMKTFFGIAGVAERIVTPDTIIDCENKTTAHIHGMRVNTWKAHGLLTFSQTIELQTILELQKSPNNLAQNYIRITHNVDLVKKRKLLFLENSGVLLPIRQLGQNNHWHHCHMDMKYVRHCYNLQLHFV